MGLQVPCPSYLVAHLPQMLQRSPGPSRGGAVRCWRPAFPGCECVSQGPAGDAG